MKSIILTELSNPVLDNILTTYPNVSVFYLEKGNYILTQQLNFTRPDLRFIGVSGNPTDVKIVQTTMDANGFNILADNIVINSISLYVENGAGICMSISGANWCNIENNNFYGSDINFTIYFSGPKLEIGEDTINGFLNDNLDMYNIFDNNIIYTKWNGDAISFCLQKHGSLRDNIVRGGKLAIYMVKNCYISSNRIYDSSAHGIICSLPSKDLYIINNYITNSVSAGINVRLQAEHGEYINENHNIIIKGNTITHSKYIGIEINNGNNIKIVDNTVKWTAQFSIYLLKSSEVEIKNNTCIQYVRGIILDVECNNNLINDNTFFSVFPKISEHSIVIEDLSENNIFNNNTISGKHSSDIVKDVTGVNVINNNHLHDNHSYNNELLNIM
jgi:hypothetical protein